LFRSVITILPIIAIGAYGFLNGVVMGPHTSVALVFVWPAYLLHEYINFEAIFGDAAILASGAFSLVVWVGILYLFFLIIELRKEDEGCK